MHNQRHNHPPPGRPVTLRREPAHLGVEAGRSTAPQAQDYWRVDLMQDWEIGFWSREFGCSEEELRRAVEHVGSNAGAVRAYLARPAR